jgi:iron complex outermembrane receptor protein
MIKLYLSFSRYLTVVLLLASTLAFGQSRTVSGKVTSSDDGTGIPGANILVKGTNSGTVTDANGNFSLSVADNDVLVVSFVGYATQEIAV